MKSCNLIILIILILCLVGVVCAMANADATNFGSDGKKTLAYPVVTAGQSQQVLNVVKTTKSVLTTSFLANTMNFTSIPTDGNCVDNSKKIAVYMPTMTSNISQGTTDATYDPYCTAMFFEYNPDYLSDSTIASKLTKQNYDLLVVPMIEMSDTAATAINNYLASGGCVWFLNDPSFTETDTTVKDRINILGGTADSNYNLISSASKINVDNTDDITNGLPSQFSPLGTTEKWSFFRSLTGSGTISGFNYKVLMSTGDCAMLVKFENTNTGARAIYSNVNMFISGGDCSYFNAATATKLFLLTKAWMLKLGINEPCVQITYPNSDKQFTLTIDDVEAATGEPALTSSFFAMENNAGVSPASVNTFFVMPSSATVNTSLQNYASNGDTHTMHVHNESFVWTDSSQSVSKYNSHITDAEAYINKAMGVSNYGFTSWRFPYTSYCYNSQKAVAASGFLIDSSNGRWTNGVYIGVPEDNNLLFPKQMLLDSAKTSIVELEGTSIYDLDAANGDEYYQYQLENYPYLQNVNFPADFVVGAHYQGAMTNTDLRNGMGKILTSSKATGTSYATFSTLSNYTSNVKKANIIASTSGSKTTVTITTTSQITDFTIKVATDKLSSATCDGTSVSVKQDSLTDSSYITKNISAGTHTFVIYGTSTPTPVANFSSNVTSGYAPLTVEFNDSSQNATVWNWDFGDGTNSTVRNPVHTYSAKGKYTVNLTVKYDNSTNSTLATINVSVLPVFPGCTKPPTDPDHDGLSEDINGNGQMDFNDIMAYYDNMDWIVANNLTTYFDYNGNKQIEFDDVVKLYDML